VTRAVVLVTERARRYLEAEVLARGAALEQLHTVVGADVLPALGVEVRVLRGQGGKAVVDEESAGFLEALGDALWGAARELTGRPEPVVFALGGSRRRAGTAAMTTVFSLLGRRRDACVEVRLDRRAAKGAPGFFFPEQSKRRIALAGGGTLDARDAEVHVEDVPLPRLRRALPDLNAGSFAQAVALGQRHLDAQEPPELVVNLAEGSATIGGRELERGTARVLWLATLAQARLEDPAADGGWVPSDELAPLQAIVARCLKTEWIFDVKHGLVRFLRDGEPRGYALETAGFKALATLRNQTKTRLEHFAKRHFREHLRVLVPEATKTHEAGEQVYRQRLALPADFIRIEEPRNS
jgi:CRISPR-associated protein (TIGR02584 family)